MRQTEQVYREILYQCIEMKNKTLKQITLSKKLGLSLSAVNLAVKKLEQMGAVTVERMCFKVISFKKILLLWSSLRNLEKDIIYTTRAEMPISEIEKNLPEVTFTAYTAYKHKFKDVPADYSEVYAYAGEYSLEEIKKRFPPSSRQPNLFILKEDSCMKQYPRTGTFAQVFADLWNLKEWYADEFIKALEKRIEEN